MGLINIVDRWRVATADEFINGFLVDQEELREAGYDINPDDETPVHVQADTSDIEVIEAVLGNRSGLYDVEFVDQNNGYFLITQFEIQEGGDL